MTALVALAFTWMSVAQSRSELRLSEQDQITNRFIAAVAHLGEHSPDVQVGGIYALERIMQDSPPDQPRIIAVLSAYVRKHAPVRGQRWANMPQDGSIPTVTAEVAAVTEVLAERPHGRDGRARVDWRRADLRGLTLQSRNFEAVFGGDPSAPKYLDFNSAKLGHADLRFVFLEDVKLQNAWCSEVNLTDATLRHVSLVGAKMVAADLTRAKLESNSSLGGADLRDAILIDSELIGVDMRLANLGPLGEWDKIGANLTRANLTGADLGPVRNGQPGADLTGAILKDANLTGAILTGAILKDADLTGAILAKTDLTGTHVTREQLASAKTYEGAIGLPSGLH
ncbi:pentapeptide repeat-containing protein [Streptomyces sp. NPDC002209]|uniref:pentapeptide repeat-containing protein n=1 Tax=Streptomyces sp. NPDC002209 TaxID=3364638 RepID=UPI0036BF9193